eukprot:TRINITY_DN7638_c0_g1_i1.p1 TRINITY_DN7638_c0_g1~~TRINITY_DN7638_c0_g1_i1.p1  ORF type:complete len:331 (+),score=67.99 TRINITY_DN7638_c0_g1_i1:54-995(+)
MKEKFGFFCTSLDSRIPEGYLPGHVEVEIEPQYSERTNEEIESEIEAVWSERVANNPKLFPGLKFRIGKLEKTSNGIKIFLGITNYKRYLGTNHSWLEKNQKRGVESKVSDTLAHMSSPLGCSVVLKTGDDRLVFMRRSFEVAEAQGLLDIPGGHPEPLTVIKNLKSPNFKKELSIQETYQILDTRQSSSESIKKAVVQEFFQSILSELEDEICFPLSEASPVRLLGILSNNTTGGKPDLNFYIETKLSFEQVHKHYTEGKGAEKYESTELVGFPIEECFSTLNDERAAQQFTVCALAGIKMFETFWRSWAQK